MHKPTAVTLSLVAAIMSCGLSAARAAEQPSQQELLDRIKALEKRLDEKDKMPAAAGEEKESALEAWLGASKFNGFASVSYFYNFNRSDKITGRSFDVNHNEFAINKLKLVLEKPVEWSGDEWDAGYRADLIFGQDASLIQSAGLALFDQGDLEQLFVTVNVPVGRGLQVSAGKWVTLQGLEVIEEVANPNWSEGNQFLFVEKFTGSGVQASYKWTDKIDTQFRVFNGWDVVKDNNNALSFMGRIGFTLDDMTSLGVVGYGGPEQAGNSSAYRKGVQLLVNRKITPKLNSWIQLDYGTEDDSPQLAAASGNPTLATDDATWWAGGLWLSYDCSDKCAVALRADYLRDEDGARTSGSPVSAAGTPGTAPFVAHNGQDLMSVTLTLNLKPYKNLQVRPEVRWDHSDAHLFGSRTSAAGRANQFSAGMGVAYLF